MVVFFTALSVAVFANYFIPGFSLALGFLLGGIVSPPDAVSAGAILKFVKVPKRLSSILEGESLLNDASSLIILRFAMIAAATGQFVWHEAAVSLAWMCLGGVAIGLAIAYIFMKMHKILPTDSNMDILMTFIAPFSMYLALKTFVIADRFFSKDGQLFRVRLKTDSRVTFTSGDLLVIYPADDDRERFYSVSSIGDAIELVVREVHGGLGSPFLKNSPVGTKFKARVVGNPKFHLPDNKNKVIMIANGTGIAPFRGMLKANKQLPIHLFYGSREREVYDSFLKQELDQYLLSGKLSGHYLAFSRDKEKLYITELIKQQAELVTQVLRDNGTIMICGSLTMQKDVIKQISLACKEILNIEIQTYLDNGQIVSDCY